MSREYYDDYRHGASRKRRKSLPGSVFNGVMLILSVATGAAMIVTLLAPFVHPGRTWIFPVLGLVAPAVYVITLLVTLYWIIRWRWRILCFPLFRTRQCRWRMSGLKYRKGGGITFHYVLP